VFRGRKSNGRILPPEEGATFMTMAPGQRKRGFWLELLFISVLLFLLIGARAQKLQQHGSAMPKLSIGSEAQRTMLLAPPMLK
jgi:hypothetical protein